MDPALNWLDEVIIVNESNDERIAGDVSVYRSEGDALNNLEAWWVENSEGHAFSATGNRLVLGVGASRMVVVVRREECREGPEIVLECLRSHARDVLQARQRQAQEGRAILSRAEEEGQLPTSVEGLVAYIGFPWTKGPDRFFPGCLLLLAIIVVLLAVIVLESF